MGRWTPTGGDLVRWVAQDYVEELSDGSLGRVHAGDVGRFVTTDGVDETGIVVDFDTVGAFVLRLVRRRSRTTRIEYLI